MSAYCNDCGYETICECDDRYPTRAALEAELAAWRLVADGRTPQQVAEIITAANAVCDFWFQKGTGSQAAAGTLTTLFKALHGSGSIIE